MSTTEADISAALGKLMGQVLVREPLEGDDDFFDSGGDSVRAIEVLQLLIEQRRPIDTVTSDDMQAVLLEAFFEDASPNALAAVYLKHLEPPRAAAAGRGAVGRKATGGQA
jgi:hypothetical protein